KFLSRRIVWRSGARVEASVLYAAYCDDCKAVDDQSWHFTKTAFGRFLSQVQGTNGRKLKSRKSSTIFYENIALVDDQNAREKILRAQLKAALSEASFGALMEAIQDNVKLREDLSFILSQPAFAPD